MLQSLHSTQLLYICGVHILHYSFLYRAVLCLGYSVELNLVQAPQTLQLLYCTCTGRQAPRHLLLAAVHTLTAAPYACLCAILHRVALDSATPVNVTALQPCSHSILCFREPLHAHPHRSVYFSYNNPHPSVIESSTSHRLQENSQWVLSNIWYFI